MAQRELCTQRWFVGGEQVDDGLGKILRGLDCGMWLMTRSRVGPRCGIGLFSRYGHTLGHAIRRSWVRRRPARRRGRHAPPQNHSMVSDLGMSQPALDPGDRGVETADVSGHGVEKWAEHSELANAFALGVAFKCCRGSTPAEHRA